MKKVYTEKEAADWFLKHSEGNVIAVNSKGEEKECEIYPEAANHINS